jgi:hypothetical protein
MLPVDSSTRYLRYSIDRFIWQKGEHMEIQAISSGAAILAQSQSTTGSKSSQPVTPPAGGAPPVGGGAKPAATSDSSSSNSSTEKIYDKRDADQDGIVSYQEELLYSLKHPDEDTQDESSVSTSQIQAGLNAYKQSQKANNLSAS